MLPHLRKVTMDQHEMCSSQTEFFTKNTTTKPPSSTSSHCQDFPRMFYFLSIFLGVFQDFATHEFFDATCLACAVAMPSDM
jgi:hypothetical protein